MIENIPKQTILKNTPIQSMIKLDIPVQMNIHMQKMMMKDVPMQKIMTKKFQSTRVQINFQTFSVLFWNKCYDTSENILIQEVDWREMPTTNFEWQFSVYVREK